MFNYFPSFMLVFFLLPLTIRSQEIECGNSVYISTHISTGTSLYRVQVGGEAGISNVEEIFINNTNYRIGCMGYSVVDKMIYAMEFNTNELLRINAIGEITNLGIPRGLDTTLFYYAGDIFPSGRDFLIIGSEEQTKNDKLFFAIDVFDLRATPLSVISDGNVAIQDMTRDPIIGNLYGFDNQQGRLVEVNNGQISNFQFPSIAERFTSIFFDPSGQCYGLGEEGLGSSRKFYTINQTNGQATFLKDGPMGNDSDACGCPYTFQFFRKMTPQQVVPCGEVTIEYSFLNTSGSARTNLRILDTLPPELTITEIVENTNAFNTRVISGPGSNVLDLTRMEALLGEKSRIIIKASVSPDAKGVLSSQAVLENLPLALNPQLKSDNRETVALQDPNIITILESETAAFEKYITYACDNSSAIITAPIPNAIDYLWNDGSTASTLSVTTAGVYTVEMTTACETFSDEIVVNFDKELPYVDLGEERIQEIGQPFSLEFITNLAEIAEVEWSATETLAFDCNDCLTPTIRLNNPATITITISDARGCTVTDEVFIDINDVKKIYAPTVFSPNEDGINDLFYLQGTNGVIRFLRIFDRWGNLIFTHENGQVNDIAHGWAGTFKEKTLSQGVYIWSAQVIYADATEEQLMGTVTLIR